MRHFERRTALPIALVMLAPCPALGQPDNTPLDDPDIVAPADEFTLSANIALASEYRFRGVDLSGGDPALQGGVDLAHASGFYAGTWASTLDDDTVGYGGVELDLYGGWSGAVAEGLTLDIGGIGYLYPDAGAGEFDYYEFYSSLAFAIGPGEAKVGVAYAPDQASLGDGIMSTCTPICPPPCRGARSQ